MSKKKGCLGSLGKIFKWFIILYLGFGIIGGIIMEISDDNENISLADGYDISAYNVVLDVKEDNTIEVTENLTVNFTSNYKHGIFKFTPQWLEYTGKDGETIKRKSTVTNYRAVGDEYTIDTVKKKKRIKIGSADEYVGAGEKTYVIKYTYDMGKDPYKGFDELIFHAYGDYWGTEIKNASIQVNMPKNISGTQVNFFLDKYRETNVNEFVDYTINENTIYAKFNQEKYYESQKKEYCNVEWHFDEYGNCEIPSYYNKVLKKSLTIDIELPEGYFVGGSWNYGWISFVVCLIILFITIWNFIRWKKFGKDFPKKTETVEFYPPENYSSAEIGYIYSGQTNEKLTISLIIQLASKGYIKIDELEKKNNQIQITNLMVKPVEKLSFDELINNRVIKVKKLKEGDSKILSYNELKMMTNLFKKGDEKEIKTNLDKFLKVKDTLVKNGFIEIVFDNQESRFEELNKRKEEYEESKKQYEKDLENYNEKLKKMEPLTSLEVIVYESLFTKEDIIILSKHKTFYRTFDIINQHLESELKNLINDKIANIKMKQSIFISIIVTLLFYVSYYLIEDMDPRWSIIYSMSFICIFINIYFTIIMKRKTEYGETIIAKVNGFKNFLETVEKNKLEALVLENPDYFYKILPYTYVLNISKKWIEKFENIPILEKNMGSYNYNSYNSLNNLYRRIYYPKSSSNSSSSRGCSSCGGGGSSSGGGCSSCGGGGSW